MARPLPPDGNRNALLALHYHEADPRQEAEIRAHAEGCASCQEYLAMLRQVEGMLGAWQDEAPPAGAWEALQSRITRVPRRPPARALPGAAALLALLPGMAAVLALAQMVGAVLRSLPFWPWLAQWPGVDVLGSSGLAVLLLVVLGGLGSLALAPALLLESRRDSAPAPA